MTRKINWWEPQIGSEEYQLVKEVLDSNYLNEGELTERFEKEMAARMNAKFAIATTSGTAALFLSLWAMGVGPGDEVLVPDMTFIATANAVLMCNARPILIDVDATTLNMDPQAVRRAITKKTRAIVPVHVSGRSADLDAIMAIAKEHNIPVIEDAAEALLSAKNGKCLGTIGKLGCFSFSPNKTITTGQGGLIVTDDEEVYVHLRQLKDQGRASRGTGGDDMHPVVGFNFKFTNLQAAIGLGQVQLLDARLKRMKEIYKLYREHLQEITNLTLPGFDVDNGESPQWVDAVFDERDKLVDHLLSLNMHCRRFWHPIHRQKPFFQPDQSFPNSSKLATRAVWLPSAFTLTDDDVASVCKAVANFAAVSSAR